MKNFGDYSVDSTSMELCQDAMLQEMWQGLLSEGEVLDDAYTMRYIKIPLDNQYNGDNVYIDKKLNEYAQRMQAMLTKEFKERLLPDELVIPNEIFYDEQLHAIYVYFLLPNECKNLFEGEEEWSFRTSEVPANVNACIAERVDVVLDQSTES